MNPIKKLFFFFLLLTVCKLRQEILLFFIHWRAEFFANAEKREKYKIPFSRQEKDLWRDLDKSKGEIENKMKQSVPKNLLYI